jgi:NAD(P)-dependent dehydrogenase (short-subunit alcohol dehydrogenase family)
VQLTGRTAVVTGASRGNGLAIARGLLERGCRVWVLDIDGGRLEETVKELSGLGPVDAVVADVGDADAVEAAFERIEAAGSLADVLVNNAGIMPQAHFLEVPPEDYLRVIRVNLDGVWWCTSAFARHLVAAGAPGAVVNVSSMASRIAPPRTAAYCASKGGVSSLTRALAVDLGPHSIRVNDIAPGVILTDMNRHLFDAEGEHEKRVLLRIPAGRIGYPEDLIGTVAFLASEDSAYLTGVSIAIDGGYVVR